MLKLALDAGHYRHTVGKRCLAELDPAQTREWVLNDRIARLVEQGLAEYADPRSILKALSLLLRHIGMGKKAEKLETAMSRCKLRVTGSPENARCSAYADELLSNL